MSINGKLPGLASADIFDRVARSKRICGRLYRVLDHDAAILHVLASAHPDALDVLEGFLDKVEQKILILDAIAAETA